MKKLKKITITYEENNITYTEDYYSDLPSTSYTALNNSTMSINNIYGICTICGGRLTSDHNCF